jgi:hypothetical protein
MNDATKLLEGIIAENADLKKQVESLLAHNEKMNVELSVQKDRLKELEPYEVLADKIPDVCNFSVDKDVGLKVYAIAQNLWGAKANPFRGDEKARKNAISKIDLVVEKMIMYITRNRQRVYEFMQQENLAVIDADDEP